MYKLKTYIYIYVHILMSGCPKKGTYREFWDCGPQKIPRLHQNSEYIYINMTIYTVRHGLAF